MPPTAANMRAFEDWSKSSAQVSTRILGRRMAPFPLFLIPHHVPHGFTQDPSTDPTILVPARLRQHLLNEAQQHCRGAVGTPGFEPSPSAELEAALHSVWAKHVAADAEPIPPLLLTATEKAETAFLSEQSDTQCVSIPL